MAWMQFGDLPFNADLVAFDKDGTLIDLEFMWGRLAVAWVERLAPGLEGSELREDLYGALGYDLGQLRTRSQSPLAIATVAQLRTIAAGILYRHGTAWTDAEDATREAFAPYPELPLRDLIRPVGDLVSLLGRLKGRGVRVGVVTTDQRAATEETLRILGIAGMVDHLVCGDDGLPSKPAPDALLATSEALDIPLARTVVVGDTMADLLMARRAGAGLAVSVLTGPGDREQLAAYADAVIDSVEEIRILERPGSLQEPRAGTVES